MARLADVAKVAGVSIATASRVFGRPDKVEASTAQKVFHAAEQLGYVANSTARSLATGSSNLLGLVLPDLSSSYFGPLIGAVQTVAESSGYELIIVDSRGSPATEIQVSKRLQGRVDGLILASPRSDAASVAAVARQTPLVTINRELAGLSSVSVDLADGLIQLCELMVEAGNERIAYVGGPAGSLSDDARYDTIAATATQAGADVIRLGPVPPKAQAGVDMFSQVRHSAATGVIAYNALVAHGLILEATHSGLSVPQDLAVSAADDLVEVGLGLPDITALTQPMTEVGRLAGQTLIARIANMSPPSPGPHAEVSVSNGQRHIRLPAVLSPGF